MWEGSIPEFSNGVVVELAKQFLSPEVVTAVWNLVGRLLGWNLQRLTSAVVHDRLRMYLIRTENIVKTEGATMSESWLYFQQLQPGGKHYQPHFYLPPSLLESLVTRLSALVTGEEKACNHCGMLGDHRACHGCLQAVYCSRLCQQKHWHASHRQECAPLADQTFSDAVLPLVTDDRERSLQNRANRYQGLYEAAKLGLEVVQDQVHDLEQLREQEGEERAELSSQLKSARTSLTNLNKSRAGLTGSLSRAKNRVSEESTTSAKSAFVETEIKVEGVAEKLVVIEQVEIPGLKHIEVFSCKGEYGNPFYLRIPRMLGGAAEVGSSTVWRRAHSLMEVVQLLASKDVNSMKAEDLEVLWKQIIHLNQGLVKDLIKKSPGLLKQLLELSPTEANRYGAKQS